MSADRILSQLLGSGAAFGFAGGVTRVASLDLSGAERSELLSQLERPVDLHDLVAAAARTPEIASEIYSASLLAIDPDTPAERAYLAMLAARLVDAIHHELESAALDRGAPPALAATA